MWHVILSHLPSPAGFICAAILVVVLGSIGWFNQLLHKWGDPPWKKEEEQKHHAKEK